MGLGLFLDAQSGDCPDWDSHRKDRDDKCDPGQIMCHYNGNYPNNGYDYCYVL